MLIRAASRLAIPGLSAALLVAIGALEAAESARQIEETAGPLRLRPSGVGLTALGLLASAAVYVGLGWSSGPERQAVRSGVLVGAVAGLVGGTIRAAIIAPSLAAILSRYAVVPDWVVLVVMALFVAGCVAVSAAAGAALAWSGWRLSRGARTRPPA